jgi:GntR family transcriptional regulator
VQQSFQPIDKDIPIPLYYQIRQQIKYDIQSGVLKAGDQLPTEAELQEKYGVSRNTVRQAISGLVYEGLVVRSRSVGTVVAKKKVYAGLMGLAGFTSEVLRRGGVPEVRILEFGEVLCPPDVVGPLNVRIRDVVVALLRLRIVDGEKVGLEHWYAPPRLVPGIRMEDFAETGEAQSAYHVLRARYGITVTKAIDTMSAVTLEKPEADLLGVEEFTPALVRTRISYTDLEVPICYSSGVFVTTINTVYEAGR